VGPVPASNGVPLRVTSPVAGPGPDGVWSYQPGSGNRNPVLEITLCSFNASAHLWGAADALGTADSEVLAADGVWTDGVGRASPVSEGGIRGIAARLSFAADAAAWARLAAAQECAASEVGVDCRDGNIDWTKLRQRACVWQDRLLRDAGVALRDVPTEAIAAISMLARSDPAYDAVRRYKSRALHVDELPPGGLGIAGFALLGLAEASLSDGIQSLQHRLSV